MLLGWGVGAAAMRGALAARDPALLERQMKAVAARLRCVSFESGAYS
jgi:hypothetical protein